MSELVGHVRVMPRKIHRYLDICCTTRREEKEDEERVEKSDREDGTWVSMYCTEPYQIKSKQRRGRCDAMRCNTMETGREFLPFSGVGKGKQGNSALGVKKGSG